MKATVANVRKVRREPDDVYIGRAGKGESGYFGNPYQLHDESQRLTVLAMFERYARERIVKDVEYRERVRGLHGKRLLCFCAPKECHGDVLAQIAAELNGESEQCFVCGEDCVCP